MQAAVPRRGSATCPGGGAGEGPWRLPSMRSAAASPAARRLLIGHAEAHAVLVTMRLWDAGLPRRHDMPIVRLGRSRVCHTDEKQGRLTVMLTRRSAFKAAAGLAAASAVGVGPARAADKVVKVGIDLSFTGADATSATRIANGAILAFDEANKYHEVPGITFDLEKYDDGTATAGQYDPAQAATNARKMVSDPGVLRRPRPADVGRRQGDGADPERRRPRHHHALVHQPRHHRPEIRRPVPPGRQGDLLPHRRHGRLPGPEHGQLHGRDPEGEVRLCPRRFRRLRRGPGRCVPEAGRKGSASRCSAATGSIRRRPTTRPC